MKTLPKTSATGSFVEETLEDTVREKDKVIWFGAVFLSRQIENMWNATIAVCPYFTKILLIHVETKTCTTNWRFWRLVFHRQWTGCMKRWIIPGAVTLKLLPSQYLFMRGAGKIIFQNLFLIMYRFQRELREKDSWRKDRSGIFLRGGQACQNKKYQSF